MNTKALFLFIFSAFLFFSDASEASTFDNWKIVFCDTCSNSIQYENAAKVADSGYSAVFNLNTITIKAFQLYYEPAFGGRLAVSAAVPQEAVEALQRHNELKQALEKYLPQTSANLKQQNLNDTSRQKGLPPEMQAISGPFGGICGPEARQDIATWIPDGPFGRACAGHDSCYAEGASSKGLCDEIFASDLYTAIHIGSEPLSAFEKYLMKKLLQNVADIYVDFVKTREEAYDAYCDIARNASKGFCTVGFEQKNTITSSGSGQSSSFSGSALGAFGFTLEYRCVRTIFDLDDGFKIVTEQCFLAPVN